MSVYNELTSRIEKIHNIGIEIEEILNQSEDVTDLTNDDFSKVKKEIADTLNRIANTFGLYGKVETGQDGDASC